MDGERTANGDASARLIAAARRCYDRKGAAATTMAEIAREAGVVRATLYRYFPSREAVQRAVFREEVKDFIAEFRRRVTPGLSFCNYLLDFLVFSVRFSPAMPLHRELFSERSALWDGRSFVSDRDSLTLLMAPFRKPFQFALERGEIRSDLRLGELLEFCARLLVSYLLVPEGRHRSDAALRGYFERVLIAGIRK